MKMLNSLENIIQGWGPLTIFARLVIAMIMGLVIGFYREVKNRSAGIKTHVLVCVGSALTMMTSEYIVHQFPGVRIDIARIGAQVVSGVGFLGVGTIIVTGKNHVKGLTTAAGLWASACMGLAIGIGFFEGALLSLAVVMFALFVFNQVDEWVHANTPYYDYYIEFKENKGISEFLALLKKENISYSNFNLMKKSSAYDGPILTLTLKLKDEKTRTDFLEKMDMCEDIVVVHKI